MLNNASLVALVATKLPEKSRAFYADTLGLTLISDDPFAIVFDAHGVMLRVQKVQTHTPQPHTVLGWDVADVHARVVELTAKGVLFERYAGLAQDAAGVWASPSGAQIAWFKDPDGNMLSLTQFA